MGVYEFTNPKGTFALLAESTISVYFNEYIVFIQLYRDAILYYGDYALYLQKVPVEDVLLEEGLDYSKTKADKCFFQNIVGNSLAYTL